MKDTADSANGGVTFIYKIHIFDKISMTKDIPTGQ